VVRGLLALAMLGLILSPSRCVGAAGQEQATAQDVWLYIPFDGSLDSLVPTRVWYPGGKLEDGLARLE